MKANKKMGDIIVKWYPFTYADGTETYEMDAVVCQLSTKQGKMYHISAPTKGELWAKLLECLGWHLEEEYLEEFGLPAFDEDEESK